MSKETCIPSKETYTYLLFTFYAGVARSRSGSSSFTVSALNKPFTSSSSSSYTQTGTRMEALYTSK